MCVHVGAIGEDEDPPQALGKLVVQLDVDVAVDAPSALVCMYQPTYGANLTPCACVRET